jgi:hypothetical protein
VKKKVVAKSKEVKSRTNLAESSKEGYGSKRTVLAMMRILHFISQRPHSGAICHHTDTVKPEHEAAINNLVRYTSYQKHCI